MAVNQEPRNKIYNDWLLEQSGFADQMDDNLLTLGAMIDLSVVSTTLTVPPTSPVDGDMFIPAATATGAWTGHENKIVIWRGGDVSAWEIYDVSNLRARLIAYDETNNKLVVWSGTNWSLSSAVFS